MQRFRVLIFDSDGVLGNAGVALPMARELIATLNERGFPFFVLTNSAFLSTKVKSEGYAQMGLAIEPWCIIGSSHPVGDALVRVPRHTGRVFATSSEDPTAFLGKLGWVVDNASAEIDAILLFDDDWGWTAERVTQVLNLLLKRPDLPVIVPNPDLVYPDHSGRLIPTSGAWASLLRQLCAARGVELKPIFLGKPHDPIYHPLQRLLARDYPGVARHEIAMLGDSPETDIMGANRQGWTSILIRTGNTSFGSHPENHQADLQFDDLGAFHDAFLPTLSTGDRP